MQRSSLGRRIYGMLFGERKKGERFGWQGEGSMAHGDIWYTHAWSKACEEVGSAGSSAY